MIIKYWRTQILLGGCFQRVTNNRQTAGNGSILECRSWKGRTGKLCIWEQGIHSFSYRNTVFQMPSHLFSINSIIIVDLWMERACREHGLKPLLAFPMLPSRESLSDQDKWFSASPNCKAGDNNLSHQASSTQTPTGSDPPFSLIIFSFTISHPFSLILRECTSPCFPAKSNHVSSPLPGPDECLFI